MRGKYIFSLSMAVVLVSVLLTGIGVSTTTPKISVDPSEYLQKPGDVFQVHIVVSDVVNLYTYAFELKYQPFAALLLVQTIKAGANFLGSDGATTDFSSHNEPMPGVLVVGNTRVGDVGGISGNGEIAIITFKVKTSGSCALTLASTDLIDSYGNHIAHDMVSGVFYTPYAAVKAGSAKVTGLHDNSGVASVDDPVTLDCKVKNTVGTLPLTVMVKYVLTRTDGRKITVWSPQPRMTELNVNGYTDMGGSNWVTVGTAPYLGAVGDGNYVEDNNFNYIGLFDLSDITLASTDKITGVYLEAYSMAGAAGTTADVFVNTIEGFTAVGQIEAGTTWGWYFTEYPGALATALHDEATINSAQLLIAYTAGTSTITIDAVRLFIKTETEIVVQPNTEVQMPSVTYTFQEADKGKYPSVKAYCYYSFAGNPFVSETAGQAMAVTGAGNNPKIRFVLIVNPGVKY